MSKEQSLNKTIAQIWENKYAVPLYQRNFAWTEEQIGQLLQDIYDNAPKSDNDDCGNYYLGSLVVLERKDGVWEVIDGQQRLTCLHLICKYLDILNKPCLTYDSRPEVERFFADLFIKSWNDFKEEYDKIDNSKISRLKDALSIVEIFKIRTGKGDENTTSLKEMTPNQRNLLAKYISSKVILVRIPLPQDTDVASYFEIMNNRGEQLQSHEIVKAMLMQGLGDNERNIFATIWDGCSQMNLPIQQTLSHYRGKGLFGTNFDSLNFDCMETIENELSNVQNERTIEDILNDNSSDNKWLSGESGEEPDVKYRAIIDFPNFLMHVFRLYKSKVNTSDDTEIPLNADSMPTEKPYYITDSMDFIKFLLKVRTFFDRYVIKMQGDDEDDENLKWRMLRPYRYEYNGRQTLKSKNTFWGSDDNDNEDEKYSRNSRVIKQQSMLQVTFRQRKYKRWLYELLYWLCDNYGNVEAVAEDELSKYLDNWIKVYYYNLINEWKSKTNDIMCAGTDTPHFLLNFIDYLYWIASLQKETTIRYAKEIKEFQFKYYNSVEHHLPKSYKNTNKDNIDKIGNLCLISKRKNSSLNDKGPTEKAKIEPGLQPNRSVMYQITHDYGKWGDTEIEAHQRDINDLLNQIPLLIGK
ncbi:MAG: DUF262 domain-containing HNH endonuclease family protein [Bacteroides acidifaciens]|uniref:DUF262 domain-containing protein n=1 Tax=Bacteroides acidifaciens TaxID=85831 RepID=UPI0023D0C504|nr:DUF262 domain-containing protein [Bacteroides acidifaciens]MDE6820016.1 DUF262 domain-containing HNH endonuclease family protein [Bacteroides acidifaciens]MDE6988998.1 DUF262 domain-containing HNH endonuclease family protein [Bacteroides acidifaciens]